MNRSEFNRSHINAAEIGVLAISACLFWGILQYYSPNYFLYDDNVNVFLPYARFNWESIVERHEIPFINFYQYLGENYLGQGQNSVFSPSLYLSIALSRMFTNDYYWTVDFLMLIHLVLGSAGFCFLMRKLGISAGLRVLSTLLWLTFPFLLIVSRSWFSVINIFPFLPWNLLLALILFENPRPRTAFLLGLIKALSFYAGNAQFVYMMGYTESFFLLFYFAASFITGRSADPGRKMPLKFDFPAARKKLFGFAPKYLFSIFTFLCLAAPQILPLLAATRESAFRVDPYTLEEILMSNIKPSVLIKSQLGFFKIRVFYHGRSLIYFIGLPLLLFFPLFLKRVRQNTSFKITTAFFVTALLVFLLTTDVYRYFLFLPLFDHFRWIMKHFLFFIFFFSILIALISNSYAAGTSSTLNKIPVYAIFIISVIVNLYVTTYSGKGNMPLGQFRVDPGARDPIAGAFDRQSGRTLTAGYKEDFGADNYLNHRNTFDFLLFDSPTFRKYYHFNGYNPLTGAANFHGGLGNFQRSLQHLNFVDLDALDNYIGHFSRWAGKYLITYNRPEVVEKISGHPQLALIHRSGNMLVYENAAARPFVYLDSDKSRPVDYTFGVNGIIIRPRNPREDRLVVNVAPIKGYSYMIGTGGEYRDVDVGEIIIEKDREVCADTGEKPGACRTVRRTDKEYMNEVDQKINPVTINIPANTESVELRYRDKYFFYGLYTAFGYILITGACIAAGRIFRGKRSCMY